MYVCTWSISGKERSKEGEGEKEKKRKGRRSAGGCSRKVAPHPTNKTEKCVMCLDDKSICRPQSYPICKRRSFYHLHEGASVSPPCLAHLFKVLGRPWVRSPSCSLVDIRTPSRRASGAGEYAVSHDDARGSYDTTTTRRHQTFRMLSQEGISRISCIYTSIHMCGRHYWLGRRMPSPPKACSFWCPR